MGTEEKVRFSVIVPVYNVEKYLSDCVKSVVEQEGPRDWECILVDDGSTDASGRMCDTFAAELPGVKVIHQKNQGLAAARNAGVRAAVGEWVLYLDSDDLWPQGMLGRLRETLEQHPGYDWYVARYREIDLDGGTPRDPQGMNFVPGECSDETFADRVARLYDAGHWSVWKYCLRRKFLSDWEIEFWPDVVWAEDWPYSLLLAQACRRFYFADFVMTLYRPNRPGSLLNSNLPKHFTGIAAARKRFARLFDDPAASSQFIPTEQAEVWRRAGNVFWPEARAAATKDAAVRAACVPGVEACRKLYDYGEQGTARLDWAMFRWAVKVLGAEKGLAVGALLKRK